MTTCDNTTPVCENAYDEDGNLVPGSGTGGSSTGSNSCTTQPSNGIGAGSCPDTGNANDTCKPWQFTLSTDNCVIDEYTREHINIAGANINVFKLLGIHEQTKLVDQTENGNAISSGDTVGFLKEEAFTTFITEWRSVQIGTAVTTSSYIGYDFGEIKLENAEAGRERRYSVDTAVKHNIATIEIKQGNNSQNRATKIRVERSSDGVTWFGAAIIVLPDDDCLNTIHFRDTAPMRYWRLRPIEFNGGAGDYWAVQALEMSDHNRTSIDDIQDKIWNETDDRDHAKESILLKGYYDLIENQTDMGKFGIELPNSDYALTFSFSSVVALLGRPMVVGDIIELPSETQFSLTLTPVKKYLEVSDITWASEGYTPGWQPTLIKVTTHPLLATQETADVMGGLESYDDGNGFQENFDKTHGMHDGNHPVFQDYNDITDTIAQTACDEEHLPERGRDPADVTQFSQEQCEAAEAQGVPGLAKLGLAPKQIYVQDGLPPNGLPFSEGDAFPPTPDNGDYHRLTYTGIDETLPARLFRWSTAKGQWVFKESDKRSRLDATKPVLQEFLGSTSRKPSDEIGN